MSKTTPGLPMILFLIFLVLKLTGHINWSWWWVTAPIWIAFTTVFVGVVIVLPIILLVLDSRAQKYEKLTTFIHKFHKEKARHDRQN